VVKKSNPIFESEMCRSNRVQGLTDGRRDLKAELDAVHALMLERERQGLVENVGWRKWVVLYGGKS
jgi:hypothetical protein